MIIGYNPATGVSATASVLTGSVNANYPVANILSPLRSKVFRTPGGVTNVVFRADWGALDYPIGAVVVGAHNLTPTATVQVTVTTIAGTNWVSPPATVGAYRHGGWPGLNGGNLAFYAPLGTVGRRVDVSITDAANSFIEVGRIWAGPIWEPEHSADFPVQFARVDQSELEETAGGSLRVTQRPGQRRVIGLDFSLMNEADRASLNYILATASRPEMWLSLWPGEGQHLERDYSMFCRRKSVSSERQTNADHFSATLELWES